MIDALQFSSWLVVALFFVSIGLLLSRGPERAQYLAERWERLSAWIAAHGVPDADDEEEFARAELRQVMHEERIRTHLERVRHLVATDTYMSATRQLGNRMAYRQLLAEVGRCARQPSLVPSNRRWAIEAADLQTTRRVSGPESLDIRWR